MENNKAIQEYFLLRKELDEFSEQLIIEHQQHIECKAGCSGCCMEFNILPVEFHALKTEASGILKNIVQQIDSPCPLLADGFCQIYSSRPFICRTQGLPLLFMNGENWELSVCELNFASFSFEDFTSLNTLPYDKFNSRLFMLNQEFIDSPQGQQYKNRTLIPLGDLLMPA
jgi:uncharacterized protein